MGRPGHIVVERREYVDASLKDWRDVEAYRIPVRDDVLEGLACPNDGLRIKVACLIRSHWSVHGVFSKLGYVSVVVRNTNPGVVEGLVEKLAEEFGPKVEPMKVVTPEELLEQLLGPWSGPIRQVEYDKETYKSWWSEE